MRIGFVAPLSIRALAPWLQGEPPAEELPAGFPTHSTTSLALELLHRGHHVTVVTVDPATAGRYVRKGQLLTLIVGPSRSRHRGRDFFRDERLFMRDAISSEQVDVVNGHWNYEFGAAAVSSPHPAVVTVHDWMPKIFRYRRDPYRAAQLILGATVLRRGRTFGAISPYIEERVRRWSKGHVAFTPNGVGAHWYRPTPRSFDHPTTLISVSQGFSRWKNVHSLLAAFARVRRGRPSVALLLVGYDFQASGPAERWASEKGLTEGVTFVGEVDQRQLKDLFADADLMVHPSLEESMGMVLLEAMASRLPVLGGRKSGAVPWLLRQGRAGILTDVTHEERLAEAILGNLHPETLADYSEQGFYRANDFRIQRTTDLHEALLVRAANGS